MRGAKIETLFFIHKGFSNKLEESQKKEENKLIFETTDQNNHHFPNGKANAFSTGNNLQTIKELRNANEP